MRFRRAAAIGLFGLAVLTAAALVWQTLQQPAASTPTVAAPGAPAPRIRLPVVGGGMSDLGADRGRVVLVNFWATYCEPCRSEMPALQRLADELRGQPFRLYSVDLQEDQQQVEAFTRELGLRLYVVLDEDGDVTRAYGVRALPATFLIDQQGVLRQQRLGPLLSGSPETAWSEAWLAGQVQHLLIAGS